LETRQSAEFCEHRAFYGYLISGPGSSGILTLHCPPAQVYALTTFLRGNGAEAVAVADLDYVFSKDNPRFAKLASSLP
jgi:ATP phosphoribosyltransferase